MESLDLNIHQVSQEQISELIEQYIPLQMCRFYGLIPLSKSDGECPSCRIVYHPSAKDLVQLGIKEFATINIYADCNGISYQGEIAVHEVTIVTEALQHLIAQGSSTAEIRNASIEAGMKTSLSNTNFAKSRYTSDLP
jgi:hypothetical protein